jgi:putative ABC transport system substrate-binding protein
MLPAVGKRAVLIGLAVLLAGLVLCPNLGEAGQKIVAVQSIRVAPYEEALQGFQDVCTGHIDRFVLSEMHGADVVREVRKTHPDVILAIGMGALLKVKEIQDIPIVYLMVLNPESVLPSNGNITGVSMNISPEKQLSTLVEVVPKAEKVGLVYDSERTGLMAGKAREAAKDKGVTLRTKEIHQPTEALSAIKSLKGIMDVFWMIPDATVFSPEIVEFVLLFCLENRIPILTFADKYVEMGAFMSIGIDAHDIGRQAGEMVQRIASGTDARQIKRVDARKTIVTVNLKIARKLGITVNKEMLSEARIVE